LKPQTGTCFTCERSLSTFDARNRFVTSVLYNLPFGKGQKFIYQGLTSTLLGGWQVSAITAASSGFPLDVLDGIDQSNTGHGYDRPNAVPGVATALSEPSTGEWFNVKSVVLQPLGTSGNLGRNTVIGPGIVAIDSALLKNFNFTEHRYLQLRWEASTP
jgi:hypothetical protein